MTFQQLEYLVALDDHRHFSKAAAACHVTQPTLTLQLQKLEEQLGVQLFDRQRKPLRPTAAGMPVIAKARELLRGGQQLLALAQNALDSPDGEFRVGIIPTLAPYLLPRFLPAFMRAYPRTRLLLREMQTQEILEALRRDQLEAGILSTPLGEPDIREMPLFVEPFLLLLPPRHPLLKHGHADSTLLSAHEALLLTDGHCFREQALRLCRNRSTTAERPFALESGSLEGLRRLVEEGLGYTLLPELAADTAKEGRRLRRFSEPQPVREISLVSALSYGRIGFLNALSGTIREVMPAHLERPAQVRKVRWR